MSYLYAFAAYAIYVLLKAMQQRQVMAAEYSKMPPLSFGMAFCEVFVIASIARDAHSSLDLLLFAVAIGAGGAIGSILGTYLHVRRNHH